MSIKFENTHVRGWEDAIRGMRNPMNSWAKIDSYNAERGYYIGHNDLDLMKRLRNSGPDHRKFMRMTNVYVDITAPLYWWKEFKTYTEGRKFLDEELDAVEDHIYCDSSEIEPHIVMNSCSTMHKIHAKEFTLDDFSHEHLNWQSKKVLEDVVCALNNARVFFNRSDGVKDDWWQMIQLLPSSYNQRRTVMMNYEVLHRQYHARKNHKLDEWHDYCHWIESLPYSELITGEATE